MHGDVGAQGTGLYCASCERTFHGVERCPFDRAFLIRIRPGVDPLLGAVLDDRYRIESFLGAGGMGTVYRGVQLSVDREVAIKVLSSAWARNPQVIKRFLREARLASQLSHPSAVAVLDFGQTEAGLFYLVMELLSGRTLEDVLETEGRLAPRRVARIGGQIASALAGAHRLSILHRDLKPSNIMLLDGWRDRGRDRIRVVDFGIAKSPRDGASTITEVGDLIGTPAYMPPEVIHGGASDARSDLYQLGLVLYQLASGRPPYGSDSIPAQILEMALGAPPPPEELGVSPPLARLISRLMARAPGDRYQDATEAMSALAEAEVALAAMEAAAGSGPGQVIAAPARGRARPIALACMLAIGAIAAVFAVAWIAPSRVAAGAEEPHSAAAPDSEPLATVAEPVPAAAELPAAAAPAPEPEPPAVEPDPSAAAREPNAVAPRRAARRDERRSRQRPRARSRASDADARAADRSHDPVDVDAVHDPFEP